MCSSVSELIVSEIGRGPDLFKERLKDNENGHHPFFIHF
jgi:hypothetical protein